MTIILGSSSPRRKEILSFFNLPFKVASPQFDEKSISKDLPVKDFVIEIAKGKALTLQNLYPKDIILTADTIVHFKGTIFEKPDDHAHAKEMLRQLSGQTHEVYTSVCTLKNGQIFCDAEVTEVTFCKLSKKHIDTYHQHFYFEDKAAGYAIQNAGSIIVKEIKGCFYNIMGLPIQLTVNKLNDVGIDLWDYLEKHSF
ncbi:MAG TPA: Maf family nucleotide pyrophosphatase [Chlamydiales bacterium]|nr:Maf family nucleotide pyrophosphatase [Chlamydiales bacterium]